MTTQIKIGKMNRAQIKMMLDCLGIELADQAGTGTELKKHLESFRKMGREDYDNAYEMVINHKFPEMSGKVEQPVVKLSEAAKLINEEITIKQETVINNIDRNFVRKAKDLLEEMDSQFSAACERESKKYNTVEHVVKFSKTKSKKIEGVVPECFSELCDLAMSRKNILMVGPAGSGKTFLGKQISEALDLDYASQSCSAGISESVFTGRLLPLGKNGTFEYVESDFVRIYENGGVFLLDEIDASDPFAGAHPET